MLKYGKMLHDIIDNRESFLGDAVRPLLAQSERAHFAVGFFFFSGFKAIASELEKVRESQRALIICPAPLVTMWREKSVDRYDLGAEVLGLDMLSQPDFDWAPERFQDKHLVVLDESHNLRHTDTLRAALSVRAWAGSADDPADSDPPRNSRARDILNQIRLFHADDRIELGVEPRSLTRYFKLVENGERPLPPLLQHFLIRRTRKRTVSTGPTPKLTVNRCVSPNAGSRRLTTASRKPTVVSTKGCATSSSRPTQSAANTTA